MVELEQVQRDYGGLLGRVAGSYAASAADRADLLQEIALALMPALPRFRGESSLRTYVLRVAHNCGVRRIARRRQQGLRLDEAEHASEGRSPEEQLVARREVEQLTAAVRQPALEAINDAIYARLATGKSDAESLDFVRGKVKETMALYPEDLKKALGWSDAMLEARVRMAVSPWFICACH